MYVAPLAISTLALILIILGVVFAIALLLGFAGARVSATGGSPASSTATSPKRTPPCSRPPRSTAAGTARP